MHRRYKNEILYALISIKKKENQRTCLSNVDYLVNHNSKMYLIKSKVIIIIFREDSSEPNN